MKATDIATIIRSASYSYDELKMIAEAIRNAQRVASSKQRANFHIGQRVNNEKYGDGVVVNIGPKNIMVALDNGRGRLRAAPALLKAL